MTLSQFKDDVKIITSEPNNPNAYLQKQLDIIDSSKADFLSEEELDVLIV